MCLKIDKTFKNKKEALAYFMKPLIAKEDIKVFKKLERHPNMYCSPYRGFEFKKGFQYTESKFTKFISSNILYINQGLHAYTTIKEAKDSISRFGINDVIIEMWIPKGSKYFLGINNEIVTDNLIWY